MSFTVITLVFIINNKFNLNIIINQHIDQSTLDKA